MSHKAGTRKRIITLATKQQIIQLVDSGQSKTQVAAKFNLNESTVRAIYKRKNQIVNYEPGTGKLSEQGPIHSVSEAIREMERHLAVWIIECNKGLVPVTQNEIITRAKEIYTRLRGFAKDSSDASFTAAPGWFNRFRNRVKLRRARVARTSTLIVPKKRARHDGLVFTYLMEGRPEDLGITADCSDSFNITADSDNSFNITIDKNDETINDDQVECTKTPEGANVGSEMTQVVEPRPDQPITATNVANPLLPSSTVNVLNSTVDPFKLIRTGLIMIDQGWSLIEQVDLDQTRVTTNAQKVRELKNSYQGLFKRRNK